MAKVRDCKITITPKLDMRKTKMAADKLGKMFKNTVGTLGNIGGKAGKAMAYANQGLQLLEQLKGILNRTNGLVNDLIGKGDSIADLASQAHVSSGQLMSMFQGFIEGSSMANTQEMFQQFLNKAVADNRAVSGFRADGTEYNAIDSFVGVIGELAHIKGILSGRASPGEKEEALDRERLILDKYFGAKKGKALQDLINSYGGFHANKITDPAEQARLSAALSSFSDAASALDKMDFNQLKRSLFVADEKSMQAIALAGKQIEHDKEFNRLKSADAASSLVTMKLMSTIDELLETGIFGIVKILGVMSPVLEKIVDGVSVLIDGVTALIENTEQFFKDPWGYMRGKYKKKESEKDHPMDKLMSDDGVTG